MAQSGKGNLAEATKPLLLVLPVDVTAASVPGADAVSERLTEVMASRAIASKLYSVTQFYKAHPTIVRLHNDQQLTDADVTPPFAEDNRKAIKMGKLAGYDKVFVGSVDDYQWDDAAKQVNITVSGRIIEVETGKVVKNVVKSGASAKGGAAKEEEKAVEAARAAGESVVKDLIPAGSFNRDTTGPVKNTAPPVAKKKRSNTWLWGLLAIGVGLGIGLSGGGGGGGTDGPPAPPN